MLTAKRRFMTTRLVPWVACLALASAVGARADEPADPPGRVARISLADGAVSMQPAGGDGWVSDVLNRPLTNGDKLWADQESHAELHIGSAAVRLGGETGISVLNIDDRTVQLKLSAGTLQVRVRGLDPEQTFEIATPTASVAVLRPGAYRIEVAESGFLERIAVAQGQVAVTDQGHATSIDAGQLAEFTGTSVEDAAIGALPPEDGFDEWVADRDRREDRAVSSQYVSREVTGYEDLDDYGTWQNGDDYGPVWVPAVAAGWVPYRDGHWGWIAPWGWTWIDEAPWGFAPFHYGRWVFFRGNWCWAPGPRRYAPVYAPALVGWVGGARGPAGVGPGGPPVGWFPLGWNEVYVPAYRGSVTYVRNINVTNIHASNTVINNYITNNTTIINAADGRQGAGDRGPAGQRYANLAVAGAVTATSRTAFTSAQPVASHLARLPRETLERAPAGTGAPAIAPTASSLGRPAAVTPLVAPQVWSRPVVARVPPPPPPPSFEAQRQAVVANGGLPVSLRGFAAAPAARAGASPPTRVRADVVQVAPTPATRPPSAPRPAPVPEFRTPGRQAPPENRAPAQEYRAPAPVPEATPAATPRPAAPYRPPVPEYREPSPVREPPAVAPAPRPAPAYRPPAQDYRAPAPVRESAPAPTPRPEPEYRPPAPREETTTPREFHAPPPPPPPHEAHPPAPPPAKAERAAKPERDKG